MDVPLIPFTNGELMVARIALIDSSLILRLAENVRTESVVFLFREHLLLQFIQDVSRDPMDVLFVLHWSVEKNEPAIR